ncbi:hypothetical protein DP939_18480 [Spongiactinospora rosea]|uniref:Response regulatory domain-containing protein n=1 Tax=Spongiactinospora rosea TaxID=2248750 RepID=A0A366LY66_9ACTN|nr:response regulator transcription factor [Spongiactinospora rosea]RBQ18493.1 hypothetical protein DP939_18480 [Spongiactinospora rosea]
MRVLIVPITDTETELADMVAEGLREEGMAADVAHGASDDADLLLKTVREYDVLIIERDAPALAASRTRDLLAESPARILLIEAAGCHQSPVRADARLSKPYTYPELLTQVLALGVAGGHKVAT